MASEQVCVVATCFNEAELLSAFMERVMALPEMDHLMLIDGCHGGDGAVSYTHLTLPTIYSV